MLDELIQEKVEQPTEETRIIELAKGKYRIRRLDPLNIVIEYRAATKEDSTKTREWRVWRYYGRLEHLVSDLINLLTSKPEKTFDMLKQLILLNQKMDNVKTEVLAELKKQIK